MKKIFTPIFIIITLVSIFFIYNPQKNKVLAIDNQSAITSVKLPIGYEVQDPTTKLWTWIIDVNTVNLTGVEISDTEYQNTINNSSGASTIVGGGKKTISSSGINEYKFQDLKDNTNYIITWEARVLYSGSDFAVLTAKYECKTGNTANCVATIDNKYPPTAVPVTPINVAENNSIYKMLAPIGNITCMDSSGKDTTCISNDIGKYLNVIFSFAIGLCAALAVIMLIIAGVSYMGDESVFGKTEAKKKMFSAILGLLIALGAWALLNTINPALTGKGGLVIDTASVELTPTSGGGYYGVAIGTPGNPNANKNITTYDTQLKAAASKYGLSCTLLKSFMYAESGGVNNLTSPSGAQGLIQLMPGTFAEQGVGSDPMDAQTNIMAGASYLSKLQKNGCNLSAKSSVCDISNIQYLAASYNGGPGANKEATACPGSTNWQCASYTGYQQTRIYAPRVEANFNKLTANGWGC